MDVADASRPRRPWVAFVLSLLTPGLGHAYNGDPRRGVILYAAVTGGSGVALAGWAYVVPSVVGLAAVVAGTLAAVIGVAVSAFRRSRALSAQTTRSWSGRWHGLLGLFLLAAFVFNPLSAAGTKYFAQAYKIPAGSMLPTLAVGDRVYVTKLCYGAKVPLTDRVLATFHTPERGDIIVFKYPEDETKDFIKRVVGVPGDVVEVRNKELYVNDVSADSPDTRHMDPANHVDRRDDFGPVTVPDHSYFVMGDNRDRSLDSRFWGFVQENKIRGKAVLIYWSSTMDDGVQWDRIGRRL